MSTHTDTHGIRPSKLGDNGSSASLDDSFNWISDEILKGSQDSLAVLKSATEKLTQASLYGLTVANEEATSYIATMMDVARANAVSAITLASELARAKRPSDVVAITNAHANRQMGLIATQHRALWSSAQKLANVLTTPPVRSS